MELFISQYLVPILGTLLTALAGYIGIYVKNLANRFIDTKIKKDVAATCVQAVEQLYKDLHGQEKYEEVVRSMSSMLQEKNIPFTELELKMLVESAVGEFNKVFESDSCPSEK